MVVNKTQNEKSELLCWLENCYYCVATKGETVDDPKPVASRIGIKGILWVWQPPVSVLYSRFKGRKVLVRAQVGPVSWMGTMRQFRSLWD